MREKWIVEAKVGCDRAAEISGQQYCAKNCGAGNCVKHDREESKRADHGDVVACPSEVNRSLHDFDRLNKFEDAVGEHKQDDESAHSAGGPDRCF